MKKCFLLSCLITLLSGSMAMAQSQVGIRAGLNTATIDDGVSAANGVEEPWTTGLVAGLAFNLPTNEQFSFAPELVFSQRGYESEGGQNEVKFRYNYLELPFLARVSFGDVLKGYLNLGPTFSYAIGGKIEQDGREMDFDLSDSRYNRFEVGGAIGGGIGLNTGAGTFLIDLRYTRGFTDFQDQPESFLIFTEEPNRYKNQAVSVSLILLVPSQG